MANNKWYNNIPGLSQASLPATIERGKAAPLDKYSLFDTYEDAMDFVTTHAAAFTGAFVYVLNDSAVSDKGSAFVGTSGAYIVSKVGADGELVKLAASSVSDDIAQDLSELQNQLNECDFEDSASNKGVEVSLKQVDGQIKSISVDASGLDAAAQSYADSAQEAAITAAAQDATSKANSAEANAKSYADGKVKELSDSLSNALHFLGNISTSIVDGDIIRDTDKYSINGSEVEGSKLVNGDIVIFGSKEFVVVTVRKDDADQKCWSLLGDVTGVQDLLTWNDEEPVQPAE